jgi:cytochrome c-type biogenesis protein CcmE
MRARTKRLWVIGIAGVLLAAAATLTLLAIRSNAMFFMTPGQVVEAGGVEPGKVFKLGGMVEEGSLEYGEGADILFRVTDGVETLPVTYTGIVPDLFREGEGVVADGAFGEDGVFRATRILAKHDENYVPRELRDMHDKPIDGEDYADTVDTAG